VAEGTASNELLVLDGITRDFPGVRALSNVSFSIRRGEVHALVGENGAGKSTLMHIIGGVLPPSDGRILFDGTERHFTNAHEANRAGIRVVYQELSVVPNLTVAENIFANSQPVNLLGLIKRGKLNRRAARMIQMFGEDIDPDIMLGELPLGKRQIIEILKALTFKPRVVLMDEPTSSLSGVETEALFKTVRELKSRGISFIFISHHLPEIFEIADRVTVLRDGTYQGTFPIGEIDEDQLISRMVGRSISDMFGGRKRYEGTTAPVLEVEGFTRKGAFEDVSFTVNAGEILGFAGLVGAGRTETGRAVFGVDATDSGTIRLNNREIRISSAREAIANGIGYLTEDRKLQGLCLDLSIRMNLAGPSLGNFSKAGIMLDGDINSFASNIADRFNIVSPSLDQVVYNLSGGNQQKVLLGMWMGIQPRVLIVDEPTRGVDVGAKEEIYHHIYDLASRGAAIVLISSDLNEILGMSDRICVMRGGKIQTVMDRADATEENIIAHALGAGEAHT